MIDTATTQAQTPSDLLSLLERHWGYDTFLPGQEEAIQAVLDGRDSLVVMPTGGGKSVIYQLPALARPGLSLVVSPLISLMADQVQGLETLGIPAATYNHMKPPQEKRQIARDARGGRLRLLYVSPEALMPHADTDSSYLLDLLAETRAGFFAIDEAHCISQWGHDFWPSYRKLGTLRDRFPDVPIHAFTATATERVRSDIASSLRLRDPAILVGDFDRPNLTYRVLGRRDLMADLGAILDRHAGEAGVVYCATRDDVDTLSGALATRGHRALGYHAGLLPQTRRERQEAFMKGDADIIVATVAFGMGIDRSDVRFIVHAGMPPSVENYSQESGRAGRDRLPAECVLLYGAQDLMAWKRRKGEPRTDADKEALARLDEIFRFASSLTCRHRYLVEYFGQAYDPTPCGACDVCLGEHEPMSDSLPVARALLEGVRQLRESFGATHVADVLRGATTARIKERRHDQLACHGSLAGRDVKDLRSWLDQLLALGFLVHGDYSVLRLTGPGRDLLAGQGEVKLGAPPARPRSKRGYSTGGAGDSSPAEEGLFQALRAWRGDQARQRGCPAYMVFSDMTLRELCRHRPRTSAALTRVKGIGERKLAEFGPGLLAFLLGEYTALGFAGPPDTRDPEPAAARTSEPHAAAPEPARPAKLSAEGLSDTVQATLDLWRAGRDLDAIGKERGLAPETIHGHLAHLVEKGLLPLDAIVPDGAWDVVAAAVRQIGAEQPLGALRAMVPMSVAYGTLKLVVDQMRRRHPDLAAGDPVVGDRVQWLIDLSRAPDPEAVPDIRGAMIDPDATTRALALHAYAALADLPLGPVVSLLEGEREPLVRQSALRVLARRGSSSLAPLVARIAADQTEDPGTRAAAEATLARWRRDPDRPA